MNLNIYSKERDCTIDYMKGFLTLSMILSHIISMTLGEGMYSIYVNLTTFSGFMFCSGYVCHVAYINKEVVPRKHIIIGFKKLMYAYYVSAFFCILISENNLSLEKLKQYLFQFKLAWCSEFLLSWAYLYLLLVVMCPILKKILANKILYLCCFCITIIMTFISYESLIIPWLGPLIGMGKVGYFPIVQYGSYFLIGMMFSEYKIELNWKLLFISFVCSLLFGLYYMIYGTVPQRFGPSALWIVGAYFYIYVYFLCFRWICNKGINFPILKYIGCHSLVFLVVSNIFVFAAGRSDVANVINHSLLKVVLYFGVTMFVCFLVSYEMQKNKKV